MCIYNNYKNSVILSIFIVMKTGLFFLFFLYTSFAFSQIEELKAVPEIPHQIIIEGDTVQNYSLEEIYIGFDPRQAKYEKDMNILRNRIRRVYPYAKATADNLRILNANLDKLKTTKEKNQYIRASQKYLEAQFKERLKKLSRNDGKILLKLIYRETGETTFDLIKEFKSGWTAFWSNTTAKTFSLNLKSEYHPDIDVYDFYIETQLQFLFYRYELQYSKGVPPIDFNELRESWRQNPNEREFYPVELR